MRTQIYVGFWAVGLSLLYLHELKAQAPASAPLSVQDLPSPDTLAPKVPGNYLAPLEAMRSAKTRYAGSPRWHSLYFDEMGQLESFIGNDNQAIADFDLSYPPSDKLTDADAKAAVTALSGYHPADARQTILKLAKTHQIIFINEAHHVPMGRAFTLSLLPSLYAQGFRYFAAEALSEKDTQLQRRGYPTQQTGYYTAEPTFGDLVRTALKLGFKVVPYEYQLKPSQGFSNSANPFADEDLRERGEAQNIYERILKRDPSAKILLHAGYGHISKKIEPVTWSAGDLGTKTSGSATFTPMAVYFERLSGIVPFSIDQTNLYEHSAHDYENLLYRHIVSQGLVKDTPIVFRSATGQYYVPPSVRGVYDLVVCHPIVYFQHGRPNWLRMNGRRSFTPIPADFPSPKDAMHTLLVQAFYANEDPAQAIPVDQIELRSRTAPRPALLLPSGRFLLQVVNGAGQVLDRRQVVSPSPTSVQGK